MSEIRVNSLGNESNTGGPELSGITEFSGQQYFIPPKGTTAQRPSGCPAGSIRFNTDSAHLEYWNGLVWLEFEATSVELGNNSVTNSAGGTGTRGLFSRGYVSPANVNNIDYITIATEGNSQDFGETVLTKRQGTAFSSRIQSFTAGAEDRNDTIDVVTIASTGNATDFGDCAKGRSEMPSSASNSTRAFIVGGNESTPGRTDAMEYLTMATTGGGIDFGDLIQSRQQGTGRANSSVRAVFAGGAIPGLTSTMEYVTFSTLSDASSFGDLTDARRNNSSADSATRGVFAGGYTPDATTLIDYVTIASLGDATDFGDLTSTRNLGNGGTSDCVRGVFGFYASPQAIMESCQIATTGNAKSFGDLGNGELQQAGASSNGHGGL